MIKSMTGYGRARETLHGRDITVELRSVNNRYLDCTVKMPRMYIFAEDAIKAMVQKSVSRGKVDVFLTIDTTGADQAVISVNTALAGEYLLGIRKLAAELNLPENVTAWDLSRLPDVLTVTKAEEDLEAVSADLCAVLAKAIEAYNAMREREGQKLAEDILGRLDTIERLTAAVEERSPQTVTEYREKLLERMREVLGSASVDEGRLLTEAHLSQLREMLQGSEPIGRKLDFLIQEVNRESNTIGSKCCDVDIARKVVDLKAEVEKIREQVQNIE